MVNSQHLRSTMARTASEIGSSQNYLYQGTSNDPPPSTCVENCFPKTEQDKTVSESKFSAFRKLFDYLKLEIVTFLFTFSYALTGISSTSMIVEKVCLAHYQYPKAICDDLQNHTEIKLAVERLSTNYQLGHTLIQTAPAALLSCFVGPWSDTYGRKLPVSIAILGMIVDTFGSAICAHNLNTRVEYYFIPAAFTGAFGGTVSILAVVYSYASDTTSVRQRTMKYAYIQIASGVATSLGVAAGGWFYNFFGYPSVFILSSVGLLASLVWILFLMPETRGIDNKDTCGVRFKKLFSCATFTESFSAVAKQRPHNGRKQIVLLIASMCFIVIATDSTRDISYLYVHHQYDWSTTEYSSVSAIYSVLAILFLLVLVPLLKRFRTGDPVLGLIGTTSTIVKLTGIGLAWKSTVFHIANILGLLSSCATLAGRSRISKVASDDDLGKVFSFVATAESLLPVLTTVLMTQIFNVFLSTLPGMPYIVLATFLILPFSVFTWMSCLPPLDYEDVHRNREPKRETYTSIDT